jgi:serine/threonine-protein kinase
MILGQEALWHHALALSPEGRRLVHVGEDSAGRRRLYLHEWDEEELARPLPGTESAVSPFFSPDGEWVGFGDHFQKELKIVSIKGGEPVILGGCQDFRGGSWGMDDSIIFSPGFNKGLCRVSPTGKGVDQLTTADANETGHWWPQILPGGKAVLFTNAREGGLEEFQIEIYYLQTGKRQLLFKGATCAKYIPTGHIVYARKETLYAVRFDIERLRVVGSGVPVVPDVITSDLRLSGSAQFAIASDGTLAYVPVQTRSAKLRPVWVNRHGRVEPLPGAPAGNYHQAAISPDGSQVAFNIMDGNKRDVWIYNLTRHTLIRLTSDGDSSFPIWSPDKRVIFQSWPTLSSAKSQYFLKGADGRSEVEPLMRLETRSYLTSCSHDGKKLLITTFDLDSKLTQDVCVVPLEVSGNGQPEPFIQRDNMQREGVWSPDSRWVAYSSDETRWWEVYVEPYPGPGPQVRISTEGGTQPVWSRDGKELFYRCGSKMMVASIITEPEFKVTSSEVLFEGRYLMFGAFHNYDVAPDGRFLMIQESGESTPPYIHLVLNWFEELKRLAPTGKD